MRLHRFIGRFDFSHRLLRIADDELVNQMRNVLRFAPGDALLLGDGAMHEATARVAVIAKDYVELEILETRENSREPEVDVALYASVLKGEHFEFVVEKATEVGVKRIVPVVSARTVKLDIRKERLKKIIKEAAEQSGRGIVPELAPVTELEKALKDARYADSKILFDAKGYEFRPEVVQASSVAVFVGPEGGWEEDEVETARSAGFTIVSLGPLVLRAETAAAVASYLAVRGGVWTRDSGS